MHQYANLPEHELLSLLKKDDGLAFKQLYQRCWQEVYSTAFQKTRSADTAQEITQNIFITLWNNRKTQEIDNLPAYLNRCTRNAVISFIRTLLVKEEYAKSVRQSAVLSVADSDRTLLWKELLWSIEEVLKLLPPKTQDVFRKSRFEQKSVREIAQELNLSEKAVEYHITQSLRLLRSHLSDVVLLGLLADFL
jgi:RNA polymerase sigma-70 factor (ECF subfamily)